VLQVVAIQAGWIKKRRGSFFERYPVFDPVAFRLSGIGLEHRLCIYNIQAPHKKVSGNYRVPWKNGAVLFAVLLTLAMISQLRNHGKRQFPRKKEIMSDEGGRGQADFLEREIGKAACTL
jgi:hypothetical protein